MWRKAAIILSSKLTEKDMDELLKRPCHRDVWGAVLALKMVVRSRTVYNDTSDARHDDAD